MPRLRALPLLVSLALVAAFPAHAQQQQADAIAAWRGDFRFVHAAFSDDTPAITQGGLLSFDGMGRVRLTDAAGGAGADGSYTAWSPHEARFTLNGAVLELRRNPNTGLLVGSGALAAAQKQHHLLVAVRAAESVNPGVLRGSYGAAYWVPGGAAGGAKQLISAFAQFTADGAGKLARLVVAGHAAAIDDVMRAEERPDAAYELAADGTGAAKFGTGSDALNGDLRLAVAADGAVALGWSADPARPALLIAVRKNPDSAVFSFRGRFHVAEAIAENSFPYQLSTAWSSGAGTLSSNGAGQAFVSEWLRARGETTTLTTSNLYRVGSDGKHFLLPRLAPGADNLAFNEAIFVASQTGPPGQLVLGHGLMVGIAAVPGQLFLASAAAPGHTDAAVAPGALLALSGPGFAVTAPAAAPEGADWPAELGGVRVRVNGVDAPLEQVSADRIVFQAPASLDAASPAVSVEVVVNGAVAHSLRAPRAAAAPALVTPDNQGFGAAQALHADASPVTAMKPAELGETVTLVAVGLGAVAGGAAGEWEAGRKPAPNAARKLAAGTLRALVGGVPAEITAAGPAPDRIGRYRISLTVPRDLDIAPGAVRELPVALVMADAFTDLADLVVTRKPAQ